jgi:uncharacterized protein (DUF2236 family)
VSDYFPRNALIRRVSLEPALFFGAGRALLLQLAHPAVAQGVSDHSDFKRNPFARLQGTIEAMVAVVFGSEELAVGVGRRIHWIHEHVVGPAYRANDVDNLLWVHATLVDSAMESYRRLVHPMAPADEATYYEEMTRVAEVFGVPRAAQPATVGDFRRYMAEQVAAIRVTPAGRELGGFIVRPELPLRLHVPLGPALGLHRLFTVGTTPPPLREQFGLEWTADDDARYERARRRVRRAFLAVPYAVRTAPTRASNRVQLLQAARHVAAFDRAHPVAAAPV